MPFLVGQRPTADFWNNQRPFAYKTADEPIANNTFQPDNHLVIPVLASSQYWLELDAMYQSPAAAGLKIQFALPAGAVLESGTFRAGPSGAAIQSGANASATGNLTGITGNGANLPLVVRHLLVTGATAGNVVLEWAQDITNATPAIMRKGSRLLAQLRF